ncbi:MAG: tetratricopeptide repeat protein [Pirellulales bacterium]
MPVSTAQMLLKDAADKAKTAQNDGDLSEVIAIGEEALKEKPGAEATAYANRLLSSAHNRRGQMFAEHKLHDQAIDDFSASLRYDPTLSRTVHNRGVSEAQTGKHNEALADFNKALELNHGHPNTFNNRAELYYQAGMFDRAWKDFNEAVRANQNDPAYVAGRGKCAAKLGKTREAIQDLDYAVKMAPKNAELRLVRAELYLGIKGFGTAAEDYRAAAQLDPQSGQALRGLAWIMATCPDQRLRNAEECVKVAERAMQLDGNNDPRLLGNDGRGLRQQRPIRSGRRAGQTRPDDRQRGDRPTDAGATGGLQRR